MKVLVCGGRDFTNVGVLDATLDYIHKTMGPISAVIHGKAKGADMLAGQWARSRGIDEQPFAADWVKHGRAAGPIRNQQMLNEGKPDFVVAFPGGKGTADMVSRAKRHDFSVVEVSESGKILIR